MTGSPSPWSSSRGRPLHSDHQGELQPLEVAVDFTEAGISQPAHPLVQPGEPVGRIILNSTDLAAKALVQARRR